jgi:hypothetical protein
MEKVKAKFESQLKARTGLGRRLAEIYYRADVESTNRPLGSSPVITFGVKEFGPNPFKKVKFQGRLQIAQGNTNSKVTKLLDKRYRKMLNYQKEHVMALHDSVKPVGLSEELLKDVEYDQALTGGGYDNCKIGSCTASALNYVVRSSEPFDIAGTQVSKLAMEGSLKLKEHFNNVTGIADGSIRLTGAHVVRFLQETDGMIGFPVYAKASAVLVHDIAVRLLIDTGVDVRSMVDSVVVDPNLGNSRPANVVDAIAYCLDHMVIDASDMPALITTLVRIQRHGYKIEGSDLVAKDGKTRSIYPDAASPAFEEAMVFTELLNTFKDKKLSWMPSLQDKETRVDMIWNWLTNELDPKDYDALAADWSKYDATVKGAILATVIYYAIRPLYHADAWRWVDLAIYTLVYNYIIVSDDLAQLSPELYNEAKRTAPHIQTEGWTVFGCVDGLISGAKFTHGGGSLYGELVIHYIIPRILGYEPVFGPQAGDDTLLAIPRSMIYVDDLEKTYKPIQDAASLCGLDINTSKQIWHQRDGEVIKIFLQEAYHLKCGIKGIGSVFRYHAAAPFSERDKGLSIAEQYLALISKYNNGYDNPFIKICLKRLFELDGFLGALFHEYGVSAFDKIVESIGEDIKVIAQRIDLTYNWGLSPDQLSTGNVPVLPIMAEVAKEMSFPVTASTALVKMGVKTLDQVDDSIDPEATFDED